MSTVCIEIEDNGVIVLQNTLPSYVEVQTNILIIPGGGIGGNIDGGFPSSVYGGTTLIDGGNP